MSKHISLAGLFEQITSVLAGSAVGNEGYGPPTLFRLERWSYYPYQVASESHLYVGGHIDRPTQGPRRQRPPPAGADI